MTRIVRNILRFPRRTCASVRLRMSGVYRLQRGADRFVRRTLSRERIEQLASVPGQSSLRECRLLFYLAATSEPSGCLVEIGAFKGKSTAWLAEAARHSGKRLISIDPHLGDSFAAFRQTVARFRIEEVATLHRALSHDVGGAWSQPIAFLWIDGGHDYEIVLQDIRDFTPHVGAGGYVVFDDANESTFPGVVRAIRETLARDDAWRHVGKLKNHEVFQRVSPAPGPRSSPAAAAR